jgi:hypothetical protein
MLLFLVMIFNCKYLNPCTQWGQWDLSQLPSIAVKRLLDRALWEQGIRQPLPAGVKRHEWKGAHGYRKFYKIRADF